jgi:peptidoglycan-associated lipoprotein
VNSAPPGQDDWIREKKSIAQRRLIMIRKSGLVLVLVLCFGLILAGCPKKTVMKDEPAVKKTEDAARLEAERAAKEQAEKEAREREAARIKEEEARKAKEKEFEKSLVAKKQPGIEGEVLESKLLKDIYFNYDKYDVRPEDMQAMKDNASLLLKYASVKIQIEGHCDERGTAEYNLALGERRAESAKKYLISQGVSANRLSTISYGKEMPADPKHNEEAWAKNRRSHFVILSK